MQNYFNDEFVFSQSNRNMNKVDDKMNIFINEIVNNEGDYMVNKIKSNIKSLMDDDNDITHNEKNNKDNQNKIYLPVARNGGVKIDNQSDVSRFNQMTQEILEKDRKIAEQRNKMVNILRDFEAFKEKNRKIDFIEKENEILTKKLIDTNKSLEKHKAVLSELKKQYLLIKQENQKLKNISEFEKNIKVQKEKEKEKDSKLEKLKNILLKKYPKYSKDELTNIFIDMEITEDVVLTNELVKAIIHFIEIQ